MDKDDEEKIASSIRSVHRIFQDGMNELGEKYFGSRRKLNKENIELLSVSEDFKKDIKKTRKDLSIPTLKLEEDTIEIQHPKYIDVKSGWIESQPAHKKKTFSRALRGILDKYELPFYFDEWLEMHILYKHPISEAPLHRLDYAVAALAGHSVDLYKTQPTSQEKRLLKETFRRIFKIKGKPAKDKAELYSQFLKALSQVGNSRRRMRALDTSVKTLGHKKFIMILDTYAGKTIKYKKTFRDVAIDTYTDEEISEVGLDKLAARLRKQKQRLSKRHQSFKEVKK